MTEQITLEEALQLVTFYKYNDGKWRVCLVHGDIRGDVDGNVDGNVCGNVDGSVWGDVSGNVDGNVYGTISGKKWAYIETPREKLARLINESGNAELIETFNQLEDSDD